MAITDRMLMGAIAANPGSHATAGEYRYSVTASEIFFESASAPSKPHVGHTVIPLPALNPDGSGRLIRAFQRYVERWTPERREALERFASRRGWDLAMELKYGGGALDDAEAAEWQEIVNARLDQIVRQARIAIAEAHGDTL